MHKIDEVLESWHFALTGKTASDMYTIAFMCSILGVVSPVTMLIANKRKSFLLFSFLMLTAFIVLLAGNFPVFATIFFTSFFYSFYLFFAVITPEYKERKVEEQKAIEDSFVRSPSWKKEQEKGSNI